MNSDNFIKTLKDRFDNNTHRHPDVDWSVIYNLLISSPKKLAAIHQMELSEGEPDVIVLENKQYAFCDCSAESPKGRRSLCYDKEAWDSRKENKPKGNVLDTATEMGIELIDENTYRLIQKLEKFDQKTSSWLNTPVNIRSKKGAIFGDCRYDHVFIYHNGAESYYAARGFRGIVKL